MTYSLQEIDAILLETSTVGESVPATTLRQWRTALVRASVFVSYAIGVLSLDVEILSGLQGSARNDVLQTVVDDLPRHLSAGWVGGGWSLSPDASASIAAADEVITDESEGLIGLHVEMAGSDLDDSEVVADLLVRVQEELTALTSLHDRLERRIKLVQEVLLGHYASGAASVDDWFNSALPVCSALGGTVKR